VLDLGLQDRNPDGAARQIGEEQARDQNLTSTNSTPVAWAKSDPPCDREQQPGRKYERHAKLRRFAQVLRDQAGVNSGTRRKPQGDQPRA
jgi:hypothetical protein